MKHLNDNELILALDGEMENAELKAAVDHLAECDQCRERWEQLQGLSARVAEYSANLYERPSAADARGLTLIENKRTFSSPARSWGAVAAILLVGASAIAYWSSRPSRTERAQRGPAAIVVNPTNTGSFIAKNLPQEGKTFPSGKAAVRVAGVSGIKRITRVHASKAKNPSRGTLQNSMNQYTELPFSDASLPLDEATVVRVALPAAALRQAGVPIEEDNAGAMLQADVVLGLDGFPRGIRLVKNTGANHAGTN